MKLLHWEDFEEKGEDLHPPFKVEVSKHAMDKFMSVTGCNPERALERFLRLLRLSKKVSLPPYIAGQRLLNNKVNGKFYEAKYYETQQYRFAIIKDDHGSNVIVTFEEKFK
jgi:hypothetical protein